MVLMMANALARLARVVRGVGAGRMRDPSNPANTTNHAILRKSTLRRWYAQIQIMISHPHGSNKRPNISRGDALGPEIRKCHQ